jgi:signal transduction histidine kinase
MKISTRFSIVNAINLLVMAFLLTSVMLYSFDRIYEKIIADYRVRMIEEKKQALIDMAEIAVTSIAQIHKDSDGMGREEAQKRAMDVIKSMRYDEGVGYFWINDTSRPVPKMIMHPVETSLNERVMDMPEFYTAMGEGKNLFVAALEVTAENGEGFIDYLWSKPTPQGIINDVPKLSYVKLFEPWRWIIGTGVYIDDIDADVVDFAKETEGEMILVLIIVLVVAAIVIALSFIVYSLFTRKSLMSINFVNKALENISSQTQKANLRQSIQSKFNDEIGQTINFFNKFIRRCVKKIEMSQVSFK